MAQLQSVTQEILNRVNAEVVENANLVSVNLLTGLFRALFRVERATEAAEPQVFTLDDDPSLIMDKRMTPAHWKHLPFFVANGDVLARRFNQFMDFEFVIVVDLTPSMGYRWRDLYLGQPGLSENQDYLGEDVLSGTDYSSTKLYILKYLLYAFLQSAIRCGFSCKAMFFTLDDVVTLTGKTADFPVECLAFVDEHFLDESNPDVWEASRELPSPMPRVLRELLAHRQESVMVLISDFMDLVHERLDGEDIDPFISELKHHHRFVVMQVNDPHEVGALWNRDDLPTSTRWAIQRDVETPDEGGLGQQKYYRPLHRNHVFVQNCREVLGWGEAVGGLLASMVASRGVTHQKFVFGHLPTGENLIEKKLQQLGHWVEEA